MARKISSAWFLDFGWGSVGTVDASFDMYLTFDLNVGFTKPCLQHVNRAAKLFNPKVLSVGQRVCQAAFKALRKDTVSTQAMVNTPQEW